MRRRGAFVNGTCKILYGGVTLSDFMTVSALSLSSETSFAIGWRLLSIAS